MSNPLHLDKLMEGVEAWNRWRQDHSERPDLSREKIDSIQLSGVDLSYANLSGSFFAPKVDLKMANLDYADLTGAWLTKADLRGSMMQYANLFQVHLAGADLTGSQLYSARFICALLEDATFCGSDLGFAHFSMELMRGADLSGASIGNTVFSDSDLSDVKGLESIDHRAPSTVGIDTIYRSKGRIPEKFLRLCGVPDEFIAYAKSLVANRIEFYSCFISYSTKDQAFADRLYADLQNKGVRCWFAPHDVQGGRKLGGVLSSNTVFKTLPETPRADRRSHPPARQVAADPIAAQHGERVGEDGNRQGPQARGARS
jgi:uncharacterized protein YjbI with pentapeptide repeats